MHKTAKLSDSFSLSNKAAFVRFSIGVFVTLTPIVPSVIMCVAVYYVHTECLHSEIESGAGPLTSVVAPDKGL